MSEVQTPLSQLLNNNKLCMKIIFGCHLALSIWASQPQFFLPVSYMYMNLVISFCGIMTITKPEVIENIFLYAILLGVSILFDIIFLSIYHPRAYVIYELGNLGVSYVNEFRFCLGMCILNLLLKPVSCILLYFFGITAEGSETPGPFLPFMGFRGEHNRQDYNDVERNKEQGRIETIDDKINTPRA